MPKGASVGIPEKKNSHKEEEEVEDDVAEEQLEEERAEETPEERAARKEAKAAKKAAKKEKKEKKRREKEEEEARRAAKGGDSDASSSEEEEKPDENANAAKRKREEEQQQPLKKPSTSTSTTTTIMKSSSTAVTGTVTAGMAPISTDFYTPSPLLCAVKEDAINAFWQEESITVEDFYSSPSSSSSSSSKAKTAVPWAPITSFEQLGDNFPPSVKQSLSTFTKPSPIQSQAWPIVLSGRDMVGIAATGSGKTMAFLLPAFVHILAQTPLAAGKTRTGPIALILSPTRELALQTSAVAEQAGKLCGIRSACIYGGASKYEQANLLKGNNGAGVHVVVATPGRLLDLIEDGTLSLSRVTFFVLDEADRMLDMGFEKDIRALASQLRPAGPTSRQTVMFSATWPPAIQKIASDYLTKPVKVTIGSGELAASSTVTQLVDVLEFHDRDAALLRLLQAYHGAKGRTNRVIVFVLYKKEAARMETYLQGRGWACVAIHGDMSQDARTRAFHAFRDGKIPLLVATDVAARGLDIPSVEYVINYSFPLTIEDYVHRIGRTGRAGKTGIAHTFFTVNDKAHAGELVNVLNDKGQKVPDALLKFGTHVKKKEHALYGAHFKDVSGGGPPVEAKKMTFDD